MICKLTSPFWDIYKLLLKMFENFQHSYYISFIINKDAFWFLNISTSMPSLLLNRTCTRISMILPFLLSLDRPWECVDSQTVEISHHQWRWWWSQFSPRMLYSSWFSTRRPVGNKTLQSRITFLCTTANVLVTDELH